MDVLYVVPYVPNLIRVRPYNLIQSLSKRGHRVTVLTVWSTEQERDDLRQLQATGCAVRAVYLPKWRSWLNCLTELPSNVPLQAAYCWQPKLLATNILGDLHPDVIHVEHLRGARYALQLKAWRNRFGWPVPVVWDSVDCISLLFRQAAAHSQRLVSRWITRFELERTRCYEGWLVNQFDRVLVTSPADRRALHELAGERCEADLSVIPNGVDLDYFNLDPGLEREPATLVMTGKMSYHANVTMVLHFVRNILPRIKAERPDVKLWIVGKDPTPEVQALNHDPAITVTGTVADIRPYLQRATVAVAPVAYGAGIQNKVLEAMACGTATVSTSQAVSALELQPDRDVLVADTPERFAQRVLILLNDAHRRAQLGRAGRLFVEANHAWTRIAARLEESYDVHSVRT